MFNITIACDHNEAEQFAAWLVAQGHTAEVGRDTANYVDGVRTSADEAANGAMNNLWSAYCDAA